MGIVIALSVVGLAACGGGERQDEDEPEGEFPVEIVSSEFAAKNPGVLGSFWPTQLMSVVQGVCRTSSRSSEVTRPS